jgi:uncharacterized protein (TIGR02594 family)
MTTPGLVINVDSVFLNSTELKNAYAILTNLPSLETFNTVKNVLNLTIPNVLGPTTLAAFLRFCINSGFDLSSEGVRAFKEAQNLNPNKPILEVTATTYYKELGFENDSSDTPWLVIAEGELANRVREFPGDPDNPRIVQYHQSTTLKGSSLGEQDETPWCSSFVNWCMMKADIKRTKNAMARSWLNWGDKLSTPKYGCVVVLKRGVPPQGHVGFFLKEDATRIHLLNGNVSNSVTKTWLSKSDLLGYRWPKAEDFLQIPDVNP